MGGRTEGRHEESVCERSDDLGIVADNSDSVRTHSLGILHKLFREYGGCERQILIDQTGAIAAIPKLLTKDVARSKEVLEGLSQAVSAAGNLEGVQAERMKEIEKLVSAGK